MTQNELNDQRDLLLNDLMEILSQIRDEYDFDNQYTNLVAKAVNDRFEILAALTKSLKPGDLVTLKSGGPLMTVRQVADDKVSCNWFEGQALRIILFPLAMVTVTKPAPLKDDSCK